MLFGGSSMLSSEAMMQMTEGMGLYDPVTTETDSYPMDDHSNLLGTSNYGGMSSCRMNYGTNSPMPIRRCVPQRDSYRRHSAHGRITTPAGTFILVLFFTHQICTNKNNN